MKSRRQYVAGGVTVRHMKAVGVQNQTFGLKTGGTYNVHYFIFR